MDDAQTQNHLDALADLYLTGPSPTGVGNPSPAAPSPRQESKPARSESALSRSGNADTPSGRKPARSMLADELDAGDAPAPIRLGPKIQASDPRSQGSGFRSPGSLSLIREQNLPDQNQPPEAPDWRTLPLDVQSVVMASLPGFSGPWLTQYAHNLSQQRGSVLLVHLDDETIDLELVRAPMPAAHASAPTGLHLADETTAPAALDGKVSQDDSPVQTIDRLMEHPTEPVRTLLIHLHNVQSPQRLDPARRLGRCTILCGAYDSAIVDAYRLILRLAGADPQQERSTPVTPWGGQVDLFVMGSDQAHGLQAVSTLNSSAARHLRQPVRLLGCLKQMVPVNTQSLAQFPANEEHLADLLAYLDELSSSAPAPQISPSTTRDDAPASTAPIRTGKIRNLPQEPPPEVIPEVSPQVIAEVSTASARGQTPELPPVFASQAPAAAAAPTAHAVPSGVDSSTGRTGLASGSTGAGDQRTSVAAESSQSMDQELDLSRFLSPDAPAGAGVVALQARCPRHPQTQIVLDQEGCLHLLRRHDSTAAQVNLSDLRVALVELLEAGNWVREHLNLLQMTQRQCRFDLQKQPKLHLFTNQAKAAVGLGQSLGAMVQLHLLSPVRVGASTAWFSQELT